MRIAILGSVALPVPPPAQGGTEWIAYYQADGLTELGHEVLLFAAKGSKKGSYELVEVGGGNTVVGSDNAYMSSSRMRGSIPDQVGNDSVGSDRDSRQARMTDSHFTESSRKLRLENVYLSEVIQQLIERKDDYDIILNNMRGEAVFLPIAKLLNKPFANVMHLPLFPELTNVFKHFNTLVITISNAQRKDFPDLNYLATIGNCVDTEKYQYNSTASDYLLMMGSIAPHKNQAGAIRVAKKLGMKLVLAGKINDQKYFESLKPDIDGEKIRWMGELAFEDKLHLYQNAKAFLFPILWEEPFGLVMIEAMSCGTPVVAFGNGAIPEVISDGKTGFIVKSDDEEEMIEAVKKIDTIKREDCRKFVEENFTIEKMVKKYEEALLQITINK